MGQVDSRKPHFRVLCLPDQATPGVRAGSSCLGRIYRRAITSRPRPVHPDPRALPAGGDRLRVAWQTATCPHCADGTALHEAVAHTANLAASWIGPRAHRRAAPAWALPASRAYSNLGNTWSRSRYRSWQGGKVHSASPEAFPGARGPGEMASGRLYGRQDRAEESVRQFPLTAPWVRPSSPRSGRKRRNRLPPRAVCEEIFGRNTPWG